MLKARVGHACVSIEDTAKQVTTLLVAGGYDGHTLKSTEFFDISRSAWTRGPDLPTPIHSSALVNASPTSKYLAYMIGGYGGYDMGTSKLSTIYGLTKDMKSWKLVGHTKKPVSNHVALRLPNIKKCF